MPHWLGGRRPTNATPEGLATDMVHLARTRYAGVNHTHLAELLAEREGMLIQVDGSYHPWLGDQTSPFTLLIAWFSVSTSTLAVAS